MIKESEVDQIAECSDPVIRNLQITQCYQELSSALAVRTGTVANWCTFAAWASKQAGQTIRREDMSRTLEAILKVDPEVWEAMRRIVTSAKRIGAYQSDEQLLKFIWNALIRAAVVRSSDSVGRGNKKVFEEIGREFARFISSCLNDPVFDSDNIEKFCKELRPGTPPDGQQYLRQAFARYYEAFYEADAKKRTELLLLANLEIGFHEQTRLQPEIAASLDAAVIDPKVMAAFLVETLFPDAGWFNGVRLFLMRLLGRLTHFDEAIESLTGVVRHQLRIAITAHLMTLGFPHNLRLRLGEDLTAEFPSTLKEITNPELLMLLKQVDPTPDSLLESGAVSWADLPDRMHFIADMFRCYQESKDLFEAPFSPEQILALKAGRLPEGRL